MKTSLAQADGTNLATDRRQFTIVVPKHWSSSRGREERRLAEQFDSIDMRTAHASSPGPFSGEACDLLAGTVRTYLNSGGVPEELARATAQLCREAYARGLSADQTLTQIRSTLGAILASCPLTSSDRAALVALAIDECVHAFYHKQSK